MTYISDDTVCPTQWFGYHGSCYYFKVGLTAAHDVTQLCRDQDSLLATINSQEEFDLILGLANAMPYLSNGAPQWIHGVVSPDHTHNYWSLDGSMHNYISWAPGEPTAFEQIFVRMKYNGYMLDTSSESAQYSYICERNPGKEVYNVGHQGI